MYAKAASIATLFTAHLLLSVQVLIEINRASRNSQQRCRDLPSHTRQRALQGRPSDPNSNITGNLTVQLPQRKHDFFVEKIVLDKQFLDFSPLYFIDFILFGSLKTAGFQNKRRRWPNGKR